MVKFKYFDIIASGITTGNFDGDFKRWYGVFHS